MRCRKFKKVFSIGVMAACLSCAKGKGDDTQPRPTDPAAPNGLDEHPADSPATPPTNNAPPTNNPLPVPTPVPQTGVTTLAELFSKLTPNVVGPQHPPFYRSIGNMTGNMPGFGSINVSAIIAVYFSGSGAERVFHVGVFPSAVDHVEYDIETYDNFTTIDGTSLSVFCWDESYQTRAVSVGTVSNTTLNLNNPLMSIHGGTNFTMCADTKPDTNPSGYTIELLDNNRIKFKKSGTGIYRYVYPNPSVNHPGTVIEATFDMSSGIHN